MATKARDEVIDLRTGADDGERWLTVSEASELVGVTGAAVRGWYRSGRIPSRRAAGDRGAYLVPLSAILRLGVDTAEPGDDDVIDLDADGWSVETSALGRELDDARRQVEFLREQLAESAAGERAALARAATAEAELARLRTVAAATSSITDTSWLSLPTNRYESPVRPQQTGIAAALAVAEEPVDEEPQPETEPAATVPRPAPGHHADDLLPAAERRLRRGRR